MNLIYKIQDSILRVFPYYRQLVDEWEKQNADIDKESARSNRLEGKVDSIKIRIYEVEKMIQSTRLKKSTKKKIIDKLRSVK